MEQTEEILVTHSQFVNLLILTMVADPWPKNADRDKHIDFMDKVSKQFGHNNWIEAYHKMF